LNKILNSFHNRRDLYFLLAATMFFGASGGVFISTLNNYLAEVHNLDAQFRGWLEFPRELPGFLMIFIAGGLMIILRESQMAAVAMIFTAIGAAGMGYLAPGKAMLIVWIMVWSMGDHIIFVVDGTIGLKLAKKGREGRRLGQIGGARNLGTILGVSLVFLIAKLVGDDFGLFFAVAAGAAVISAGLYLRLKVGRGDPPSKRIVFKKKYRLFYAISALFGIRKQIFLAFGGWVLVSMHDVSVSTIALLYFIASFAGILVRPLIGEAIDRLGERFILSLDEILIILVCLTYAFASDLLSAPYDLWILFTAYMLDHLLFSLRVARTTYLKKIIEDPRDITPSISMGITIDHVVAMTLPILSGYAWEVWGFRWVFIIAAAIAFAGFFVCLQIRVPVKVDATT
jgi:predicted MFS family arabinose efflux permease